MKRLVLAVAALVFSATMSLTQAQDASKQPFSSGFSQLSSFLELAPYQKSEVAKINDYFMEMQSNSLTATSDLKEQKMHQAVYGNLKLMKEVLTAEQYRKYVMLLNITNNNNRLLGDYVVADTYLAHTK
ncbi:hypothetical protein [Parabacteroides sp. PF5-9]|uniref:hypothetical protein n=1 Tax=Parabacteroides sp. PF5-9 TaxID=1742404 RepID=UPI002474EE90|nr:hypothetical protein [Parabacteroides sp. PF5-9]MDH6358124.1 hypothetical protein [Parabacteroides sp. PF5-9]